MAKLTYSRQLGEAIAATLAQVGTLKATAQAHGLGERTLLRWLSPKESPLPEPEFRHFRQQIARARARFSFEADPAMIQKARERLRCALNGEHSVLTRQTKTGTIRTTTVQKPPEKWAMFLVLGPRSVSIEMAVAVCEAHGYTVSRDRASDREPS